MRMCRLPGGCALNFDECPLWWAAYLLSGEYLPFSQVTGSNARYHLAGLV